MKHKIDIVFIIGIGLIFSSLLITYVFAKYGNPIAIEWIREMHQVYGGNCK